MLLNMVMFKVTICDIGKMNINMTDKIEKKGEQRTVYITQVHPLRTQAKSVLVSPRWRYLHQTNWWKESTGDKKKSEFLLNMEELFRYYLSNIIILRIGTGLRYLWLRFVRHRKISYRTLYEGSKSKKTSELSNFENEMSNRAWGCGFILFVIFLIIFLRRFL